MGKVGDRLREYKLLFRLITPIGKARILGLGVETFLILIFVGILLGCSSIWEVIGALLISVIYVCWVIINTFK